MIHNKCKWGIHTSAVQGHRHGRGGTSTRSDGGAVRRTVSGMGLSLSTFLDLGIATSARKGTGPVSTAY